MQTLILYCISSYNLYKIISSCSQFLYNLYEVSENYIFYLLKLYLYITRNVVTYWFYNDLHLFIFRVLYRIIYRVIADMYCKIVLSFIRVISFTITMKVFLNLFAEFIY